MTKFKKGDTVKYLKTGKIHEVFGFKDMVPYMVEIDQIITHKNGQRVVRPVYVNERNLQLCPDFSKEGNGLPLKDAYEQYQQSKRQEAGIYTCPAPAPIPKPKPKKFPPSATILRVDLSAYDNRIQEAIPAGFFKAYYAFPDAALAQEAHDALRAVLAKYAPYKL